MKSTGIVRKVDELGRIVIPKELRKMFNIKEKDPLEIYVEEDTIVLKKHENSCVFCKSTENLMEHKGKYICPDCINELK